MTSYPETVGVVIPTYNECDNIEALVEAVLAASDKTHPVIVDDNSPDGTGDIADKLAERYPRVTVIHRYSERGRGTAGRDGFLHCLEKGYDAIMEMDADFSHDPADIPRIIAPLADGADVVLGSRLVKGGKQEGRSWSRLFITRGANLYLRIALGVFRVHDCTSGYRCFRREALAAADVSTLKSKGPSIVTELLFRCRKRRIVEAPITFKDRRAGSSKFGFKAMVDSITLPPKLWARKIFRRK